VFFALVTAAALANASPPSEIKLSLDRETGSLQVTAMHASKNASVHYIKAITVTIGGMECPAREFKSQTGLEKQETAFTAADLPALKDLAPGAEISVKAECNIFGSKTASIKS
jgi:hypothetical protein